MESLVRPWWPSCSFTAQLLVIVNHEDPSDSPVLRHIFIAYKLMHLTTGVYCITVAVVSKTVCPGCSDRCIVSGSITQCCSNDCAAGCFGGNDNQCHVSHSFLILCV